MGRVHHFTFEGEQLRYRGLEDNSGVSAAGKANYRKWAMERRFGSTGRWVRDSFILLPNSATVEDAKARFNIKED